jgi:hypothetical protein
MILLTPTRWASPSKSVLSHPSWSPSPSHFMDYLKVETNKAFVWKAWANSRKPAVGVPVGIPTGNLPNTGKKCYRLSQLARLHSQTFITECISPSLESILRQQQPWDRITSIWTSHLWLGLPSSLFPSGLTTKVLRIHFSTPPPKRTTTSRPTFDLIILIIFGGAQIINLHLHIICPRLALTALLLSHNFSTNYTSDEGKISKEFQV